MSDGMQPSVETYIRDGWINKDVRYRPAAILFKRGVVTEFDFTSREEMAREPHYQEFLRPISSAGAVKVGEGEDVWCLSIQRMIDQEPFGAAEIAHLAELSRCLAGAAELARAFGFARIEAALEAFEASGSPAVIVDRLGEAVRVNPSAERLLGTDLQIVKRRVASSSRNATAVLDRALHALIWASQGGAFHPPVVLPRRQGRPILAYPTRLPAIASGAFWPGQACIVFVDLDARRTTLAGDLTAAFRLTPAEARLAVRLLAEESLEAAAAKLGVSIETARNQLKSVYEKTDTHRQAQLVALLGRLAKR
jgi:DNA-binding CsgD family transcriptional regulator